MILLSESTKKLIDEIKNTYHEKDNFCYNPETESYEFFLETLKPENILYYQGATKIVFPCEKDGIVLKVSGKSFLDEYGEVNNFTHNYGQIEWENYLKSKEYNCNMFFLPVEKISETIFSQEIFDKSFGEYDYDYTFKDCETYEKIFKKYGWNKILDCFPKMTLKKLFEDYQMYELNDLNYFLKDNTINDISARNIGIKNGKIKVFDYAGYFNDIEEGY